MICTACNENLVVCACADADKKLEGLKNSPYLDPQMIANIQMARASNKGIIEKKRAECDHDGAPYCQYCGAKTKKAAPVAQSQKNH